MVLKWLFDRLVSLIGLLVLWPVLLVVAIMVKVKMSGGPAIFTQKRVGKGGKLFTCHKFRTMRVAPKVSEVSGGSRVSEVSGGSKDSNWSSVSVAGDSRITPLGAKLRHYKLDELPGLWDVLIGNMSFVGPRPDVPGYADKLEGDDRDVLKLRPGITGPATLKYRLEDEMIAEFLDVFMNANYRELTANYPLVQMTEALYAELKKKDRQEVAVWYNDHVIYPDKVRLNCYYYRHYSFVKDIQMIFATVLGKKIMYNGELI